MTKRLRIILILKVRWKEPIFHCTSVWQLYMQICWVNSNLSFEIVSRHLECFSILFKTQGILNKATRNSLKSLYALCYSTSVVSQQLCAKIRRLKIDLRTVDCMNAQLHKTSVFSLVGSNTKIELTLRTMLFSLSFSVFFFLFARKSCVLFSFYNHFLFYMTAFQTCAYKKLRLN